MNEAVPPWRCPAAVCACGGGMPIRRRRQTIGNDGTQNQRLGCQRRCSLTLRSFGCSANQWKRWDRKARG